MPPASDVQTDLKKLDHVAFRCHDAKETVDFYKKYLDMELVAAVSDTHVQSTKESVHFIR